MNDRRAEIQAKTSQQKQKPIQKQKQKENIKLFPLIFAGTKRSANKVL